MGLWKKLSKKAKKPIEWIEIKIPKLKIPGMSRWEKEYEGKKEEE